MKLYNFAFGSYSQRVNIYLAEKAAAGLERIIFDAPTSKGKWPPDEIAPSKSAQFQDVSQSVWRTVSVSL